jgi:DNA repair exonuclease SbcCD ATPase subunit
MLLPCAGSLSAILSEVEELKASADLLESELAEVSKAAEVAAKRSRRLAARSHELQVGGTCPVCLFGGGGLEKGRGQGCAGVLLMQK